MTPAWNFLLNCVYSAETCPPATYQQFLQGQIYTMSDRDSADIVPCMVEFLSQIQVQANLIVPIIQQDSLWGLLIVHQCSNPREWLPWESDLLQQLANQMAITIVDDQGRYIDVNPAVCKLFGLSREELLGSTIAHFAEPGFEIAQVWRQFCEQKQMFGEFRLLRRDGTVRETEFAAVANFIPDLHLSIMRDISDRQQAQKKICEQAALIDIATDAIFIRDLENHILFWSRGAETLYGWTAEESSGKKTDELFYTKSLSQLEAALKATIEGGSWQGELEQTTKTGREIIVASRWTLVRDESRTPQSILIVNTDITEKKQLEQQFYRAQRLESIGTLASGIAHDLNNVFSTIILIAQLLSSKYKNAEPQTQELFQALNGSAKRGANLVKQILTFARGTEGKHIVLQPGHLLKELIKVIKQTFPKSIEIVHNIPTNTLWMVEADPTQLEQAIVNLLVNARDAMPNGGKLAIAAQNCIIDETYSRMHLEARVGRYIVISISDTGTGIPPEFLERIFDPFFTTKKVGQGTGLGLSTVLGIVKNHGGFVEVSTKLGKGTQFQVFLPIVERPSAELITETELPQGQGELILIVDDELIVRETTKKTLEDGNYKILVANDGIEAIALYAQYKAQIKAVLLDILMPNMDGLTTIRTIQTLNHNVKIIAMSGLPDREEKAIAIGANKFLSKPDTAKYLLTNLSEAIVQKFFECT
ncbi:MAG: PAS domain S-box protein [Nostoc sp. ChiSLP02]|nr:PAS domain S-box protein [Nostoc sp. DedSLP05]MDZ8097986.1 PAS domain S-box protein [Nostoc sp. DedSLP01]MDZ8189955.1 PAS domain S-box protein [Nostoc sp. ChiSLP02]